MPYEINPQLITLARESRGMKQTDLARNINVDQAVISKIESGIFTAPDSLVKMIAEELDYPQSLFYESASKFPLGIHFYRKAKGLPQKTLTSINAVSNIDRIRMENLVKSFDLESVEIPSLEIDGYKYKSARHIAKAVRYAWKLPEGRIKNMTELLEAAGILVIFYDFQTIKYDAHNVPISNGKYIVFVNANMPGDRIRFSLAHELGHIVMHNIPSETIEEEANEFASEFLMPEADIKHQLNFISIGKLADLKRHWRVSMQAILMRAKQLGTITANQHQYLWIQLSKLGYRTSEPVNIEKEEPRLIKEMIELYLTNLNYSEEEIMALLHVNEEDYHRFNNRKNDNSIAVTHPRLRLIQGNFKNHG